MDVYFSPLACSLATRIALYESQQDADYHQVTLSTKRVDDGRDYRSVAVKGLVPALRTDDGQLLTEGPAVLQYIADRRPDSCLAPATQSFDRYRLQEWLNYLSTELHKAVFAVLFNPHTPEASKLYARESLGPRFEHVSNALAAREYLLDQFSVADAYLFTILNWCRGAKIDLGRWPVLAAYYERVRLRPQVGRALAEELRLAGRAA